MVIYFCNPKKLSEEGPHKVVVCVNKMLMIKMTMTMLKMMMMNMLTMTLTLTTRWEQVTKQDLTEGHTHPVNQEPTTDYMPQVNNFFKVMLIMLICLRL